MNRLAIIPARSGSKGLHDKNIALLNGKPLMAYSIEAAIGSKIFERVIVTTDSEKYADIARQFGAEALLRGENLSNDNASSFVVIQDVLNRCNEVFDYFALLQPTSPLRTSHHIIEAVSQFDKNIDRFDFLVSVTGADHAKVLVNPIDDDLSLKYFSTDFANYKRQAYRDFTPNGAIFIGKPEAYLSQKHFFGARSMAYVMDKRHSVDIDDNIDLQLARLLME